MRLVPVLAAPQRACASFTFRKSSFHKETMLNLEAYSSGLKKIMPLV